MPPNSSRVTSAVRAPRSARNAATTPAGPAPDDDAVDHLPFIHFAGVAVRPWLKPQVLRLDRCDRPQPRPSATLQSCEITKHLQARQEKVRAPPHTVVNAGSPLIVLRIGRFGILYSSVPSWLPMIGSRSLPSSWKFLSLAHTFWANSNWRTRLAQPTNAAMPRSTPSSVRAFGQGRAVGAAAPDHPAPVHVHTGVPGIHAADVRAKRNGVTVGVHFRVVEIIVALGVRTEGWIVFCRSENQRGATAPAPHQLRGDQFLFLVRLAILAQELAERAARALATGDRPENCRCGKGFRVAASAGGPASSG